MGWSKKWARDMTGGVGMRAGAFRLNLREVG